MSRYSSYSEDVVLTSLTSFDSSLQLLSAFIAAWLSNNIAYCYLYTQSELPYLLHFLSVNRILFILIYWAMISQRKCITNCKLDRRKCLPNRRRISISNQCWMGNNKFRECKQQTVVKELFVFKSLLTLHTYVYSIGLENDPSRRDFVLRRQFGLNLIEAIDPVYLDNIWDRVQNRTGQT